MKAKSKEIDISVITVNREKITCVLRGTSPFIANAMSAKVAGELLLPSPPKNKAQKQSTLKHNPLQEFRDAMYYSRDLTSPTRVVMKANAVKGAIMGAALDLPGVAKTQIGRLCEVIGDEIPIYGIPELHMSVVRCANANRTPDVRTRAIFPHWASIVTLQFTTPIIKQESILNLLGAAGMTQGIGDWRTGKGAGNYGSFEIAALEEVQEIMDAGGRAAQDAAIADPNCYDSETEALLSWYDVEVKRRGFKVA